MCVKVGKLGESLAGYAAGFDPSVLSPAQAEQVVEQASRIERIAATLKALATGRLAEGGAWRASGDRSAAHLLARRTGTTVADAASTIEIGRGIVALPQTAAAARRGELSAEQASAIVDAAGACPSAEADLLATARCSPLSELREHCARTKATAVDTEARRVRIHQRRSLRAYTDAEGEWHLRARDNPEVGARIMAALDPIRDEIFRQARVQGRHEPPDAYAADALAEMASRSLSPAAEATAGGGAAGAAEASGSPVGADTADNTAGPTRAGATPAPRTKRGRTSATPKIIVRVDLEALLRGRPVEGEVSEIAGFAPVAVSAVRDMIDSDDPFLSAVVTKGQKVVGVAHLGRRPTARQQTALQWLYPSCANQACAAQARLDYDHRLDWARSHLTVLDLLDRLCSHCHALKTRNNWSLVEGRGKRPLVAPDDLRHPRHCVETRVNGPPG